MGCGSNNENKNDENEEIKNYDERDNFYSFKTKKKVKNTSTNKKEKEKEKNNDNNSDEENNSSENDKDNKTKNNKGGLNQNNSNEGSNSELNDANDNSKNEEKNPYLQYMNKNKNKKIKDEEKESENESSHLFKETSQEMNYYSKKLKSKKKGNIDHDSNYSKIMYDYKNLFTETGEKIPEYKIYAKNYKNKEKNKFYKKTKLNGVIIVEDLKDYFPQDITRDEIQELIFESFGECIVEDEELLIPGQTVTYEQVLELCDYVFNFIKGNEKKLKENKSLQKLNIKIDLVSLDKNLIKDKLFKGKEPNENQLDSAMKSYKGTKKEVKVLYIEFL